MSTKEKVTPIAKGAPGPDAAKLDELFKATNRSDAPGLVVGVALHGKVVYRRGFGLASVRHGVANTPRTRMRVASITKHFTCLAALLLAEEGLLKLDAPATAILPELPALKGVPTLRQFMAHTSGYRCSLDMAGLANEEAMQPKGWSLAALARQTDVSAAPGETQIYNNGGYDLLTVAIERASGQRFSAFLKSRIFDPLGMSDTEVVASDHDEVPGLATLHLPRADGGWRRGFFGTEELLGAGGMVSTVDDMLSWMAHLNGTKRVGNADTWRQMLEPARLNNGLVSTYCLGLNRALYRGVEIIDHSGGAIGGNMEMVTVPAHGLDIAIMVNSSTPSAVALSRQIIDLILGEAVLGAAPVIAASDRYKHLFGAHYHGPEGQLLGFGDVEGKLGLSFQNLNPLPVMIDEGAVLRAGFEHIALGPFELRVEDLVGAGDGLAPDTLRFSDGATDHTLIKLPTPSAEGVLAWGQTLVGHYACADLAATASIAFEGDALVMRIKGDYSAERAMKVDVYGPTAFGLRLPQEPTPNKAWYRSALTADAANPVVQRFRIDTIRARRLWFERRAG